MRVSIYNASAGSGKTYRLAYKYVRDVIEEPMLYRNILAVTFTNKATEEMKRRILQQIHTLAIGEKSSYLESLMGDLSLSEKQVRGRAERAQSLILHNYSRFTVLTIDTFFQRVLRAFIQELGIDIGYNLEIESSSIIERSADALIEQITESEELRRWLMAYVRERVEEGRKWDIRDGILALGSELFDERAREALESSLSKEELLQVIAERAREVKEFSHRLEQLGAEAMRVMERVGATPDDFKYKTRSGAQIFIKIAAGEMPDITKRHIDCIESEGAWCDKKSPYVSIVPELQRLLSEVEGAYREGVSVVNTTKLLRENYRSFALLADLYRATQRICQEQNTMLLNQTSRILEEFVKESDAPFIYEKVGSRFSRYMIDEFQDTSRKEWNNFLPLLRNSISQSDHDQNTVLIVGDIKQSIYRWRGGDWRLLHADARRDLGEADCEVINMADNYRSLPNVVKFNNEIIDRVVAIDNEELGISLAEAYNAGRVSAECFAELHNMLPKAYSEQAQIPRKGGDVEGFVEVVTHSDEPPIMECICAAIDRGFRPCDIMVLTRSNTQATRIAQMLLAFKRETKDERYKFDVMTQQALLVGFAPVSQFIMAVFRLSLDISDKLQLALYNRFLKREYVDTPLLDCEVEFLRSVRMFSPMEAFEMIVMEYSLEADHGNIAYLQAIHEQIINFCNNRISDIALYLDWWEEKGASRSLNVERSESAIEILTIHKAKGLEKRVVIMPYTNWSREPMPNSIVWARDDSSVGLFPVAYKSAMSESIFAEDYLRERVNSHLDSVNMLYVALTRAVESLHIFVPSVNRKGSVGGLILEALPQLGIDIKRCEAQSDGGDSSVVSYRFGEPSSPLDDRDGEQARELYMMDRYEGSETELRLRMPSKRYREGDEFAPREIGILMHKAFEGAVTECEIFENVDLMFKNGAIDRSELDALSSSIREALMDRRVAEWFSPVWDRVRNECEIILPSCDMGDETYGHRRPDRVMIAGGRCVVVDYKFGELRSKSHIKQMRRYLGLLSQMGYSELEGYIWYIRHGEIEEVFCAK